MKTSIDGCDTVYEIGPGNGIITKELAKKAGKIIAIEIDWELVEKLKSQFRVDTKVEIHHGDFMDSKISLQTYKVFSNIPFNLTSDIVRKLLNSSNPPTDSYLIMQKEAAMKFSGKPIATEFAMLSRPKFSFEIIWNFLRTDFMPVPAVDVVMLHISKNNNPLISQDEITLYQQFIRFGFKAWKKDLKTAYKDIFTYEQWKRLSKEHGFPIKATPTLLTFEQWLGLFRYFLKGVPTYKRANLL